MKIPGDSNMGEAAKTKQKPANMISGSSSRFAVFDQSSN